MKKAFTLAEVLITLAIIGIVAAITIPSIVANHQKRELETRFAKMYRTVQQVVNLSVAENGGIETWGWKDERFSLEEQDEFVKKYFMPYLNVAKFCSASDKPAKCLPGATYKYLTGANWNITNGQHPSVLLADGSAIIFYFREDCLNKNERCLTFEVDTNGAAKPNVIGRDAFGFSFYPTGEFAPCGTAKPSAAYTKEEVLSNCGGGGNGALCPLRIIADGFKMNY